MVDFLKSQLRTARFRVRGVDEYQTSGSETEIDIARLRSRIQRAALFFSWAARHRYAMFPIATAETGGRIPIEGKPLETETHVKLRDEDGNVRRKVTLSAKRWEKWEATILIQYDPKLISANQVLQLIEATGRDGIGERRTGKFEVVG